MKDKSSLKFISGFTLIELLVVIAIIGLLSSVIFASLNSARSKARDAKRVSDLVQVSKAVELYYDSHGRYPPLGGGQNCATGWSVLGTALASEGTLSKMPTDPAGGTYMYCSDVRVGEGLYNSGNGPQEYVLRVLLENSGSEVLKSDQDGLFYTNWGGDDPTCADPYFCIASCRFWSGNEGPSNASASPNCGTY